MGSPGSLIVSTKDEAMPADAFQCPLQASERRCEETSSTVAEMLQHCFLTHAEWMWPEAGQQNQEELACFWRDCKLRSVSADALLEHMKVAHFENLEYVKTIFSSCKNKMENELQQLAVAKQQVSELNEKNRQKDRIIEQQAKRITGLCRERRQSDLRQRRREMGTKKQVAAIKTEFERQQSVVSNLLFRDIVEPAHSRGPALLIDLDPMEEVVIEDGTSNNA